MAAVVLKEPDRVRTPPQRVSFVGQFQTALTDRQLTPLVIAFFLTSLAFTGITVMFVPFIADLFGYGATEAAIFLAYIGALVLLAVSTLAGTTSLLSSGPG